MFIRKRDPRYKTHIARQAQGQSTPQRARTPKPATSATSQPVPQYVEQDWQKTSTHDNAADLEWAAAEGEDEEEWECVACGKSFRSEAAWDSHERSKKHMKAVEALKRQMEQENEELGLQEEERSGSENGTADRGRDGDPPPSSVDMDESTAPVEEYEDGAEASVEGELGGEPDERQENDSHLGSKAKRKKGKIKPVRPPSPVVLPRSERRSRKRGADSGVDLNDGDAVGSGAVTPQREHEEPEPGPSKKEKRRAKEAAKKAAAKAPQIDLVRLHL